MVHDRPPAELPGDEYPVLLTTGRVLEHWHGGSMSHRSRVLETLEPEAYAELNPEDAERLGIDDDAMVTLRSPRGMLRVKARRAPELRPGMAFMSFHWPDAPANLLTTRAVDPVAKIPEFKVCSVRVESDTPSSRPPRSPAAEAGDPLSVQIQPSHV